MSWYQWDGQDLLLRLRLQPKASRDAFVGPYGEDEFKVTITAPPIEGKANAHLIRFLAKQFELPRSHIKIEAGETSRSKRLRLKSPKRLPILLDESMA
ncbi:MAG: DUF167 family protein [Chromatiales bacterium]|jgi:uncharacterized protein (TIGR00251 family)